eukprot:1389633-Pyramimonas_sp.AAC.1
MSAKQQQKGNQHLWEVVTADKVRVTVEVFHRMISDVRTRHVGLFVWDCPPPKKKRMVIQMAVVSWFNSEESILCSRSLESRSQ